MDREAGCCLYRTAAKANQARCHPLGAQSRSFPPSLPLPPTHQNWAFILFSPSRPAIRLLPRGPLLLPLLRLVLGLLSALPTRPACLSLLPVPALFAT